MPKQVKSISMRSNIAAPRLHARGVEPKELRGAVSYQDLNKRPTAVPVSKRSMRKR